MLARSLALWAAVALPSLAGEISTNPIAIYLNAGSAHGAAVHDFEIELGRLMQSAGYAIDWIEAPASPQVSNRRLIVFDLQGPCLLDSNDDAVSGELPAEILASAPVSNGAILPFGMLHCDVLNQVIGRRLAGESGEQRAFLYGRALARLAAHELYHILSGSQEHSREGVAKASFSANNLLEDGFHFEAAALSDMRPAANGKQRGAAASEVESPR